jgi:GNAT superfamily N-acetyltransferase
MPDFMVRRCTETDGELLRRMRLAMLANDGQSFNVDAEALRGRDNAWWESWALAAAEALNKVVFFAEAEGEATGMIAAHLEDGVVHTGALWVEGQHRSHGIANALLNAVETWAHDVRATMIELSVARWNEGALRLYDRHYYRDTGRRLETRFGHDEIVLDKPVGT